MHSDESYRFCRFARLAVTAGTAISYKRMTTIFWIEAMSETMQITVNTDRDFVSLAAMARRDRRELRHGA